MAIKKLVWKFDKKDSCIKVDMAHSKEYTKDDPETGFVFTLARYRNEKTELEYLGISCNHGDIGHGEIFTSYPSLSTDLKRFKDYGVALSDLVYMNLQKKIEESYLYLTLSKSSDLSLMQPFLEEIAKLVETESPLIKFSEEHKVYCLDTTNFDSLVDTTFKNKLTPYMVRKWLADNEFTKVSKNGRYTYQLRLDGKLVKPICFYQEELLSYMESITKKKEPEPATV